MSNIRNISIPEPCHQSWNEMTPEGHGRHCQQCSKVVTDFTAMSNAQIINYFNSYGNICGRFGADQLNSLNNQLDLEEAIKQTRWKRWAMAASLFLATAFFEANAQSSAAPQKQEQGIKDVSNNGYTLGKIAAPQKADKIVTGTVYTADDNQPVAGATIKIHGNNTRTVSNAEGKFTLGVPAEVTCIEACFVGYQTQSITVDPKKDLACNFKLVMKPMLLGEPAIVMKRPHLIKRVYNKCIKKPIRKIFHS